ncbi:MAG: hypothetical protein OXG25_08490 [Gammaproteobacteria bacterium]|nr:hypothetical protein [Gammaproteobacteria bacterium]
MKEHLEEVSVRIVINLMNQSVETLAWSFLKRQTDALPDYARFGVPHPLLMNAA